MQLKEFILRDYFVKSLLNIKAHKGDNIEPYPLPSNKMWLALLYIQSAVQKRVAMKTLAICFKSTFV